MLGVPQHRLIYLCEKDVVRPDYHDARGRGSSRSFSALNLLEFAVALRLREFEIQASLVKAVLYVLRAFEDKVRKQIPDFRLPESLRAPRAPDLRAIIGDQQRIYFSLRVGTTPAKVFGGIELSSLQLPKSGGGSAQQRLRFPEIQGNTGDTPQFGMPEGSRHARVEVSITRIARDLPLEG